MRKTTFIIAALFLSLSLVVFGGRGVFAEDPSVAGLESIAEKCLTAQTSIGRIYEYDLGVRTNLGAAYKTIGEELMAHFNARAAASNLDVSSLSQVAVTYNIQLKQFQEAYRLYGPKLLDLSRMNCQKNPQDFYTTLKEVRSQRSDLHAKIITLNQSIDQYFQQVETFQRNFLATQSDGVTKK